MEKTQVIDFIRSQLALGAISKEELIALAEGGVRSVSGESNVESPSVHSQRHLINIFYVIGGIIVLTGVLILVAQHWDEIDFLGRVLVTLGIAGLAYIVGILFKAPTQRMISQVMFAVSAALWPIGSYVVLVEAGSGFSLINQVYVALGLLVLFGIAYLIVRRTITALIIIGFGTWAYFAMILELFQKMILQDEVLKWAAIVAGLCYIFFAYSFREVASESESVTEKQAAKNILLAVGTLGVLGASITLGGLWDFITLLLVFAFFYASVFMKSRAMLILSAMFLVSLMLKISYKYFIDSIGWPIALVAGGFLIIGIGYLTYYVNKNYIAQK